MLKDAKLAPFDSKRRHQVLLGNNKNIIYTPVQGAISVAVCPTTSVVGNNSRVKKEKIIGSVDHSSCISHAHFLPMISELTLCLGLV